MYNQLGQVPAPPAAPGAGAMVPGPGPGMVFVPGLGMQKITDWTEGILYDTEQLPVAIATGQTFTFFRNMAIAGVPKTRLQTNMDTPSQMPSGWRGIVYGMHVMCQPGTVHADVQAIMANGYAQFITGGTKREKEGPLWSWPSPFGLTGLVSQDGLAVASEISDMNNGVPSPAAIGRMQIPIDLIDELTFEGQVTFHVATALTAPVMLYFVLRAFINKPVR